MARHFLQSTRPLVDVARNNIEIFATVAAMAAAAVVPMDRGRDNRGVWTVEVRTADGAPVERAPLTTESWMPDHERMGATAARMTTYLGDGRYRVEGLRLDRRGWWNVKLTVAAPSATDSLAFNLIR